MADCAHCIECGGRVNVSFPSLTVRVEECMDCGRHSHWRVCGSCGEVNGPRRVICLECGVPFDRKAVKTAKAPRVPRRAVRAAAALSR